MIACCTAHHYLPALRAHARLPIVDLVDASARDAQERAPGARVGVLATSGSLRARVFHTAFARHGVDLVSPLDLPDGRKLQDRVMQAIYGPSGLKAAGRQPSSTATLQTAARRLVEALDIGALLVGCTEVSLALAESRLPVPVIDPLHVGAVVALERLRAAAVAQRLTPQEVAP